MQCHIVDDIVVGSLHKGRVDVAEWSLACRRKSCRECYCVTLGNAHIETALGHLRHHYGHRTSRRHSRCYAHNSLVEFGEVEERLTKDILHTGTLRSLFDALSGLGVKASRSVPNREIVLCRCIAVTLLGDYMEQLWRVYPLQCSQGAYKQLHIVTIHTTKVAETKTLEEVTVLQ